jgi:nitroreductase
MTIPESGTKGNEIMEFKEQVGLTRVMELMRAHRSVRKFTSQPIPDGWIETIVESAQWASSTCFRQAYSVIAVTEPEKKRALREVCGGQRWVEECAVFLAFCVDMNRLDDICKGRDKRVNLEHTETFLMTAIDAALFMQNAALAAESLGLGIVMIGGLRDNPRAVIELLQLPHGVFGISGMCIGFAEQVPAQRPRLPLTEVLHWEEYQTQGREDRLAEYDERIQTAGTYKRRDGSFDRWTEVMARTTSKPPPEEGRYELREILSSQGFELK